MDSDQQGVISLNNITEKYETIVLASASPRRKELLHYLFHTFEVIPSNLPEQTPGSISPYELASFLSRQKATDIFSQNENSLIIAADTVVIHDNQILGKPKDKADAVRMIRLLSGDEHDVVTGVSIYTKEKQLTFSALTEVCFGEIPEQEIATYVATKEPYDKAGGYGIQGTAALFIEKIDGDFFNVMGLPLSRLRTELLTFL